MEEKGAVCGGNEVSQPGREGRLSAIANHLQSRAGGVKTIRKQEKKWARERPEIREDGHKDIPVNSGKKRPHSSACRRNR